MKTKEQIQTLSRNEVIEYVKKEMYSEIKWKKLNISNWQEELQKNFLTYFSENSEKIYKNTIEMNLLEIILKKSNEIDIEEVLIDGISILKKYCNRSYNVRAKSTDNLVNESSTWEYVAKLEMIENLEQKLTWIHEAI